VAMMRARIKMPTIPPIPKIVKASMALSPSLDICWSRKLGRRLGVSRPIPTDGYGRKAGGVTRWDSNLAQLSLIQRCAATVAVRRSAPQRDPRRLHATCPVPKSQQESHCCRWTPFARLGAPPQIASAAASRRYRHPELLAHARGRVLCRSGLQARAPWRDKDLRVGRCGARGRTRRRAQGRARL
jgi:hypothetical protein